MREEKQINIYFTTLEVRKWQVQQPRATFHKPHGAQAPFVGCLDASAAARASSLLLMAASRA